MEAIPITILKKEGDTITWKTETAGLECLERISIIAHAIISLSLKERAYITR